ncbi:MAG: aminotransferase class III-fold pyridoxal phosphate-dependent enzyme [Alphaproteobacteria bacterium]
MSDGPVAATNSAIDRDWLAATPKSAALAAEARRLFPSGVVHDSRYVQPYGPYIERAAGAHKWDADDRRYIDYFAGHGALILGHNRPEVQTAVADALAHGTHMNGNHRWEIRWGQAIQALVPAAERVRFVASGTEATLLAVRIARAATGRDKVLRFRGHFHGWHDEMVAGYGSHFDLSPAPGVTSGATANALLVDPNDRQAVAEALATGRVAAVILEPLGSTTGQVPIQSDFLHFLRDATEKAGSLLIFDEVITGFRCAPGGLQEAEGVIPDLTCWAKIVAGGLPGGAIGGRHELMERLDYDAAARQGFERIYHPGTFNGNPLAAAAGATTLELIPTTGACDHVNRLAADLRHGLNRLFRDTATPWACYGRYSAFHIFLNPEHPVSDPDGFAPEALSRAVLATKPPELMRKLRLALYLGGIDPSGWPGGLFTLAHSQEDVAATVAAFADALRMLRADGDL